LNTLNKILLVGFVVCLGLCLYLAGAVSYAQNFYQTKISQPTTKTTMNNNPTVFACIPGALTKEQRDRAAVLNKQLIAPKPGFTELADGYSFTYTANEQTIKDVAEFVAYERLCCPFLNFEMSVEGENFHLRMRGEEGAKDFIKAEFNV
jgi:hypothetical protein